MVASSHVSVLQTLANPRSPCHAAAACSSLSSLPFVYGHNCPGHSARTFAIACTIFRTCSDSHLHTFRTSEWCVGSCTEPARECVDTTRTCLFGTRPRSRRIGTCLENIRCLAYFRPQSQAVRALRKPNVSLLYLMCSSRPQPCQHTRHE